MTEHEWDDVRNALKATWPGLARWMQDSPDPHRTLQSWRDVLERFEGDEVQTAIADLFAEREELPRSYERYPAAIAAVCRKRRLNRPNRTTYADGEPTYRCPLCRDVGMVTCYHPDTLREIAQALRAGDHTPRPVRTCAVRCTCEAAEGRRFVSAEYDAAAWCVIDRIGEYRDELRRIEHWMSTRRPVNHESAFDAFAETLP